MESFLGFRAQPTKGASGVIRKPASSLHCACVHRMSDAEASGVVSRRAGGDVGLEVGLPEKIRLTWK